MVCISWILFRQFVEQNKTQHQIYNRDPLLISKAQTENMHSNSFGWNVNKSRKTISATQRPCARHRIIVIGVVCQFIVSYGPFFLAFLATFQVVWIFQISKERIFNEEWVLAHRIKIHLIASTEKLKNSIIRYKYKINCEQQPLMCVRWKITRVFLNENNAKEMLISNHKYH